MVARGGVVSSGRTDCTPPVVDREPTSALVSAMAAAATASVTARGIGWSMLFRTRAPGRYGVGLCGNGFQPAFVNS